MDIIFFNSTASKELAAIESAYLNSYILMADTVYFDCSISAILILYAYNEKITDKTIILIFEQQFQHDKGAMESIEQQKMLLPTIIKFKKIKHKDKRMLQLLALYNQQIKLFREALHQHFEMINKSM